MGDVIPYKAVLQKTGEAATLTKEQSAAYRLAEACMREEIRLGQSFNPLIVKWIFEGCGLWESLKSLDRLIKAQRRAATL